jgi:hypothetical protein
VGDEDLLSDEEIQNYKKQLRNLKLRKKKDEMGSDIEEDEERGKILYRRLKSKSVLVVRIRYLYKVVDFMSAKK